MIMQIITFLLFWVCSGAYALAPQVQEAVDLANALRISASLEAGDGVARRLTKRLLYANPTKRATPEEVERIVDAHLEAELFYAFNTAGNNRMRDHRIIYDFISQLESYEYAHEVQKTHLTILTILSLAAQEYFWNPKTDLEMLRKRVKRELRYGLFEGRMSLPGASHAHLKVDDKIYLRGDVLDRLVEQWINEGVLRKLTTLNAKITGARPETGIYGLLRQPLEEMQISPTKIKVDLHAVPGATENAGISGPVTFSHYGSAGDGACGFHSIFSPHDGPLSGCSLGNSRYKLLTMIDDFWDDPDFDRFYFSNSGYTEVKAVRAFAKELKMRGELPPELEARMAALIHQDAEFQKGVREAKREIFRREYPGQLIFTLEELGVYAVSKGKVVQFRALTTWLRENGITTDTELGEVRDELIAKDSAKFLQFEERVKAINPHMVLRKSFITTVRELQGFSTRIDKSRAFVALNEFLLRHKNLIVDALKGKGHSLSTKLVAESRKDTPNYEQEDLKREIESLVNRINLNDFSNKLSEVNRREFKTLIGKISEVIILESEVLPYTPDLVFLNTVDLSASVYSNQGDQIARYERTKVIELNVSNRDTTAERLIYENFWPLIKAKKATEIKRSMVDQFPGITGNYWLDTSANYLALYALAKNLNIFVWGPSTDDEYSPLVIDHEGHREQYTHPLPFTVGGSDARLDAERYKPAHFIYTSLGARNIFVNGSGVHYEKYIAENDWIALAKQVRHDNWRGAPDRNTYYPAPKPAPKAASKFNKRPLHCLQ